MWTLGCLPSLIGLRRLLRLNAMIHTDFSRQVDTHDAAGVTDIYSSPFMSGRTCPSKHGVHLVLRTNSHKAIDSAKKDTQHTVDKDAFRLQTDWKSLPLLIHMFEWRSAFGRQCDASPQPSRIGQTWKHCTLSYMKGVSLDERGNLSGLRLESGNRLLRAPPLRCRREKIQTKRSLTFR